MLSFDLWLEAEYDVTEEEFRKMSKSEKVYYRNEYNRQLEESAETEGK